MKVSAINNYQCRNVNFEGKKTRETDTPVHKSNPVKAVPVALLIAMMPVNAPLVNAQRQAKQVEYAMPEEENEVTAQFPFVGAMPDGSTGIVVVKSTDNNDRCVELHLNKNISSYAIDVNSQFVDAYRLKEIEIVPEKLYSKKEIKNYGYGTKKVETKYYVVGSGTEYSNPPQPIDPSVEVKEVSQPIVKNVQNGKYEISEKLYKYLKEILKDKIEVNEEESSVFIIEGRRK